MRVLITGATGFLGANLVCAFTQDGHNVIAADISPPPDVLKESVDESVQWNTLDVTCESQWEKFNCDDIDIVVSAAASTPGDDDPHPPSTLQINTLGCLHTLHWAHRNKVERFIYVSSSGVYRGFYGAEGVLREDLPVDPPTSYGKSKVAAEKYVDLYRRRNLDGLSVRLPSLFGPWERPTGVRSNMSAIYEMMKAAVTGCKLSISSESASRDWTYAPDAAGAILHLATDKSPPIERVVNISTGSFVSAEEIIRSIKTVFSNNQLTFSDAQDADLHITPTSGELPMGVSRLQKTGHKIDDDFSDSLQEYARWLENEKHRKLAFGTDISEE